MPIAVVLFGGSICSGVEVGVDVEVMFDCCMSMPSSNGGVDDDGEEGVDVVDVVGVKGINISFQFSVLHFVTILNFWIWKYYFLTNMHLFTIESHCALLISHNHFQGRLIHCCWLFRLIRLMFLCVILKNSG